MPSPDPIADPSAALAPGAPERIEAARARAAGSVHAMDWMNLAFELLSGFEFEAGHAAFEHTLRCDPDFLPARWLQFQTPLAAAPDTNAAAQAFCEQWESGLAFFERLDPTVPEVRAHVWGCIGSCTAFYRHYLGHAPELQRRYGRLVHRWMAALDPGEPSRPASPGRRRVAFCSPYFYQHTVARLFLPLIERLDPQRFEIHLLHFGPEDDAFTARARRAGRLHVGPRSAPQWRHLLARLRPDAIVYLDIGMHPLPQMLAALRLAPRQAVLWGHPVSTGLPSIDAFLSPDEMEPADAQGHYSERLVRLPGLGHGLDVPPPVPAAGSSAHATDLICAQSVFKLLPEHDAVFGRILAASPASRLHLVPHFDARVRARLLARMRRTLADCGVDADARLTLHAYQPLEGFRALAARCALNLDSFGWSGGMSSLDLLGLGLPTVTLFGECMRSRQTAALLTRLGVPELIAADTEHYVELATSLARNEDLRRALGERLRGRLDRLDDAEAVASALADWLSE